MNEKDKPLHGAVDDLTQDNLSIGVEASETASPESTTIGNIIIVDPAKKLELQVVDIGDIVYRKGDTHISIIKTKGVTLSGIFNSSGLAKIPIKDIIDLAKTIHKDVIVSPIDQEESDISHQKLVEDIKKSLENPEDHDIQVFEGDSNNVTIDQFSCDNAESIHNLIHFIEANDLEEKRPWCVAYNLYRCLLVTMGR